MEVETEPPAVKQKVLVTPISTEDIGQTLHDEYGQTLATKYGGPRQTGNEAIDYFFLQIRKRNVRHLPGEHTTRVLHQAIIDLKERQGLDWKKVSPGTKWPALFFGKFPKQLRGETERNREERLNKEVREVLKKEIEEQLTKMYEEYCEKEDITPDEENMPTVSIMITRACKYTGPDIDYFDTENDD